MFGSFVNFITAHYELYSLSFYAAVLVYIWYGLGWFFSTDYYDNYIAGFECQSDITGFHIFVTVLLGSAGLIIAIIGVSSGPALSIYTIFWLIFILPTAIIYILDFRASLRKKRGKL